MSALRYNSYIKFSAVRFACTIHRICANMLIEMLRTCLFTGGLAAVRCIHMCWLAGFSRLYSPCSFFGRDDAGLPGCTI